MPDDGLEQRVRARMASIRASRLERTLLPHVEEQSLRVSQQHFHRVFGGHPVIVHEISCGSNEISVNTKYSWFAFASM